MDFEYPAPKSDKRFNYYWDRNLGNITSRDNFKQEHLDQLAILCQMYVDCEKIEAVIQEDGMTYESSGRNGKQIKTHPLLTQLNVVRTHIAVYAKMLGLTLNKDTKLRESEEELNWK